MAVEIKIPEVGESVTEGLLAAWLKDDGAWVERDEPLLEVETDKITQELVAPASGLLQIDMAAGETVEIGAIVGSVDDTADKPADKPADTPAESSGGGDGGAAPEPAAPAAADAKAQPAPAATQTASKPEPRPEPKPASSGASSNGTVRATPLAEKLAAQFDVDLSRLTPTGASERVREQDVLAFIQNRPDGAQAVAEAASRSAGSRETRTQKMSPLRQRIAARLVEAQQTAAMLTTFNEADMTEVMALRKQHKEAFKEKHGVGLGFMSFFVKASVSALHAFPRVNAAIVDDGGKPAVQEHDYCDIAMAVSTPKGLTVPVLRNCETLGFADIEKGIGELAVRARDGKLDMSDLTGGTFTITNGGVFGSMMSTPILNPPQSAILGMHAINKRPVEHPSKPGEIALRPMMYLALSYDHRIVDGAEAVGFLKHIKECIEDPSRIMLSM